jgi:hypothetical protein
MKSLSHDKEIHHKAYLLGLALLVFFIPFNRYLIIIPESLLLLNWLIEGNFRQKFLTIRKKPALLIFVSIFFLYAAGCLLSDNIKKGLEIVSYMIILLIIPIVMGTSGTITKIRAKQLLLLFSFAVMVASMVCIILFVFNGVPSNGNFRTISAIKAHLRFSLEIIMAVFILIYFTFYREPELTKFPILRSLSGWRIFRHEKIVLFTCALFLVAFLFFIKSLTGIIVFTIMSLIFGLVPVFTGRKKIIRLGFLILVAGTFLMVAGLIMYTWFHNFHARSIDANLLDKYTVNGNPYEHNTASGIMENGHYIDIYVCESELRNEWNKISTIPYNNTDLKGQAIQSTIKRYLTSKGLRKDSASLHSLKPKDLSNIEKGLTNYRFHSYPSLYQRIYETLWEIQVFKRSGFVQGHPFVQRLIFMKMAGSLIRENPWTGIGPGDVLDAVQTRTFASGIAIGRLWNGAPHNQFIFFMLAFGIPGFLWIMFSLVYPVIITKAYDLLLFNLFTGIMFISMLTLDTLESAESITFFVFFYSFFVFGTEFRENKKA